MISAYEGEEISLSIQLSDLETTLYPVASIYNQAGTLLDTVDLEDFDATGMYRGVWTPPDFGQYQAKINVYNDVAKTILSDSYPPQVEEIFILVSESMPIRFTPY